MTYKKYHPYNFWKDEEFIYKSKKEKFENISVSKLEKVSSNVTDFLSRLKTQCNFRKPQKSRAINT